MAILHSMLMGADNTGEEEVKQRVLLVALHTASRKCICWYIQTAGDWLTRAEKQLRKMEQPLRNIWGSLPHSRFCWSLENLSTVNCCVAFYTAFCQSSICARPAALYGSRFHVDGARAAPPWCFSAMYTDADVNRGAMRVRACASMQHFADRAHSSAGDSLWWLVLWCSWGTACATTKLPAFSNIYIPYKLESTPVDDYDELETA